MVHAERMSVRGCASRLTKLFVTVFVVTCVPASVGLGQAGVVQLVLDPLPDQAVSHRPARAPVKRVRPVRIDLDGLYALGDRQADDVSFALFDDVVLAGEVDQRIRRGARDFTVSGMLTDEPHGRFTLTTKKGIVLGSVQTLDGRFYQIEYTRGGYEVRDVDPRLIPPCDVGHEHAVFDPAGGASASSTGEPPTAAEADDGSVIDVMVVYTAQARDAAGGTAAMETRIQLGIDESNQIYANSGVDMVVRLVHRAEVDYVETGSFSTELSRLRSKTDGYMDEVHVWRDTYGADIVSLWVSGGNAAGIAYLMTSPSTSFASNAFNVCDLDYAVGYYTFAHEMGHNMGCHHAVGDSGNQQGDGLFNYSNGWRDPESRYRTVLAYSPGTRLAYLSNPDVLFPNDYPTGQPLGLPDEAHNALSTTNAKSTVAKFRTTVTNPGNLPPQFDSDPIVEQKATVDVAYSGTLADDASDPNPEDTLTFGVLSGPAWLSVAADGALSGIPGLLDAGPNEWTVQVDDGRGGTDQAVLQILVIDPSAPIENPATSDIPGRGTVSGTYVDTHFGDDVYQSITERESGGKPSNRTSQLEHTWTFDVTGGEVVTFFVEAYHSADSEGDDFVFAYSTDNVNFTDMVIVTKTADDDTPQSCVLPAAPIGTVYVRVVDADRTPGARGLDTVYVDEMFIRCEGASNEPPGPSSNPHPADEAIGVSPNLVLSWTAGQGATSHDVYFGTNPVPGAGEYKGEQTTTEFDPGLLSASTLYYWRVDETNANGTTAGTVWSFTTGAAPTTLYVSDIDCDIVQAGGPNYRGQVVVTVLDDASNPVAGATVTGTFSGSYNETVSGTTGADGRVTLATAGKSRGTITYTFTVDTVTKLGYTYVPGLVTGYYPQP